MDTATTSLKEVLKFPANDYKVWCDQGCSLAYEGRYEEALVKFDQALAIQPKDCAFWRFRAVVLIQLEHYSEALASCEKALEIQPNDKQSWICKGAALNYLGHYQESYASYKQALGVQHQLECSTSLLKGNRWRALPPIFRKLTQRILDFIVPRRISSSAIE